jgi:5-methylcytosine-specific restriction endonuclease McrA
MKNPNPVERARRLEMRRKYLGSADPKCFYCGESDIECLEIEHPLGRNRDPKRTRIVCRNCHRKLEMKRDLAGLTNNGKHNVEESPSEEMRTFLLRLADDHEATADSLRRKADSLRS